MSTIGMSIDGGQIQQKTSISYKNLENNGDGSSQELLDTAAPHASFTIVNRSMPRLVDRSDGRSLIKHRRMPNTSGVGYISDFFTTVIDAPWYGVLLTFCVLYLLAWFLFGMIWWATVAVYAAIPSNGNYSCVENTHDFASSILFSIETQVTIGYGYKFIRSECGFAIFLVMVQSLTGLLIDSFLLGLVFAKLSRPRSRRNTILFSNRAVVYENQKGQKVLEFRIADIRRSQLVEAHVRLQLYWNKAAEHRQEKSVFQYDLDVGYDSGRDRLFLLCPVSVVHIIDENSPLSSLTQDNLHSQDLEIVVILEAIVEATGLTAQALWSYTQDEIFFNYEFAPMVHRQVHGKNKWEVDFSKLSYTRPITVGEDL